MAEKIGKKYNREWIFKGINQEFSSPNSYLVSGSNGAGKSTFLQVISGFKTPSDGKITYHKAKVKHLTPTELIYKEVAYVAPYISVFEEYTMQELISFYTKFKPRKNNMGYTEFVETIELSHAKNKAIKNFSSGMKQRVKLGLAILAETDILLLDEPTSNLDKSAIKWYQNLIKENLDDRLIFVASNDKENEAFFCKNELKIEDYK